MKCIDNMIRMFSKADDNDYQVNEKGLKKKEQKLLYLDIIPFVKYIMREHISNIT